jgi:adenylate cyclase class IV
MELTTEYSELEVKYDAGHVEFSDFQRWMQQEGFGPPRCVRGYDHYYRQGDNVIRFREPLDNLTYELTCKVRKSATSTQDRHEIDIHLDTKSTPDDVKRFLALAGFKHEKTIHKWAEIYHAGYVVQPDIIFALYQIDGTRKYLEVEVEKSDKVSIVDATAILVKWNSRITERWDVKRIELSLYEIYTGKLYKVDNEPDNH